MPLLKEVLPELELNSELRSSEAYLLRNDSVIAIKLTTGSPCSTHSELFSVWPGPEKNIDKFFVLDNGRAVGICGGDNGCRTYPVARLSVKDE